MAAMEINFSRFQDRPALSLDLSVYDRAQGLAFGIMAGWVVSDALDQMISYNMISDGSEVYQIACLACDSVMRRVFTRNAIENSKDGLVPFIRICEEGFNSEVPCAHFDQYLAYREGLFNNSEYAIDLDHQILVHSRLMEVGEG